MADGRINKVLIVGGGTAGWLTAGILAAQLNSRTADAVQVELIESPTIPILGVGEGTWPTLRTTLEKIGVDESEFMRECDATFKQGTEFVNWVSPPAEGKQHSYFHPLSAVFHSAYDFSLAPYWILQDQSDKLPYDLAVATQSRLCKQGLAPKKITTPAYAALQNYSYHLDANKFARFLTKHCVEKLSVKHTVANVCHVNLDEDGMIASVDTDNKSIGTLEADFFVDCSGSRALLIGDALKSPWQAIDNIILNDSALAIQIPYSSPDMPIATHTIATAQEAGWTWDIGLHSRRGIGYVYSSQHSTDERAEQTLRNYIGPACDGFDTRKIKLKLGYRREFWKKNCVAIGMSAGFVEPLEASAIFLIEAAANMLADQFPRHHTIMPYVEHKFNQMFRLRWEKSIEFIKLHYCISKRRDTTYWIDNCNTTSIPDNLQRRLEHWRFHPPTKYDFDYAYEPFVLDSYLFVLYGMQFNTDISDNASSFHHHDIARQMFAQITKTTQQLTNELPTQRELVEKVYRYGFQRN